MKRSTLGLQNVHYAMLLTDPLGGAATYDTPPKRFAGAIDAALTVGADMTPQYSDDGKSDSFAALGDRELALQMKSLPYEVAKQWFGCEEDANGVLLSNREDSAAYFALGFYAKTSTGKRRFVWLFKCKASLPDETYHTVEGGSVTFQQPTINISIEDRESDNNWRAYLDEDEDGVTAGVVSAWFDAVYEPTP